MKHYTAQKTNTASIQDNPKFMAEVINLADVWRAKHTDGQPPIDPFKGLRAKAPQASTEPIKINQAEVIGDMTAPEVVKLLAQKVVAGVTESAPKVLGENWVRIESTWDETINKYLTLHPAQANKGGKAFFFAESELSGKLGKNGAALCYRNKGKIREIYAISIDVDGGCLAREVVDALRARGIFGVVYTTHSNVAKGGPGSERFRVIVPLAQPYVLNPDLTGRGGWGPDYDRWESLYAGVCDLLIPASASEDVDSSAFQPMQMMYAPARPEGGKYQHYVVAGAGLDLSTVVPGDPKKYKKSTASLGGKGGGGDRNHDGEAALLSDQFDLQAWRTDHGADFMLSNFLETLGWDVRGSGGDGYEILCPNHFNHDKDSGDSAWAIDGPDADKGKAAIFCHHDHCQGLYTEDFLRILADEFTPDKTGLPDGYTYLSDMLCDPSFYVDAVDVESLVRENYIEQVIEIAWLKTSKSVKDAFAKLTDKSTEAAYAALYAGVMKGGSVGNAKQKLVELMAGVKGFSANDRKRLEGLGRKMLQADKVAYANEKEEERRGEFEKALTRTDLANLSMDPAEPLGDDIESSLATLANRYAVVDLAGSFRIVRKPDLEAFKSETDSTITIYRKDDFVDLHLDRVCKAGDAFVNPAKIFLETEKRKSGLVFAPYPVIPGPNDFNMYQGRKLKSEAGKWRTLHDFIFRIICKGDRKKRKFLIHWMAHMVQYPGQKPGTAVVCRGEGGTGKGMFGRLLMKLTAPHCKQLEKESHVTGPFAGEHLSKCILAIVTEAIFGKSGKVSSELKALITELTMQVEAKGFSLMTVLSYIRLYIDSNDELPILVEGNGSERRYFVLETDPAEKANTTYFKKVVAAIEGDEMAALLGYLETYDPASVGMAWGAERIAPETAERRLMGWHSMSAPMRRFAETLRDGAVTLAFEGEVQPFTPNPKGGSLRVPITAFRAYIAEVGNVRNAGDSDVVQMFKKLFPALKITEGRGKVKGGESIRWWEFPAAALGDAVDLALFGDR